MAQVVGVPKLDEGAGQGLAPRAPHPARERRAGGRDRPPRGAAGWPAPSSCRRGRAHSWGSRREPPSPAPPRRPGPTRAPTAETTLTPPSARHFSSQSRRVTPMGRPPFCWICGATLRPAGDAVNGHLQSGGISPEWPTGEAMPGSAAPARKGESPILEVCEQGSAHPAPGALRRRPLRGRAVRQPDLPPRFRLPREVAGALPRLPGQSRRGGRRTRRRRSRCRFSSKPRSPPSPRIAAAAPLLVGSLKDRSPPA